MVRRPFPEKPQTMVGLWNGSSSHIMHMKETEEIGGDHHLAALDLVQQRTVSCAQHQGERRRNGNRHHKAHRAGEAQLNRERGAEQPGDDAERQTEVQPAAGVNHRHHGKNQNRVPAESVDSVADLGPEVRPDKGGRNKQQQQEAGDDQTRQAEALDHFLQPVTDSKAVSVR